jgi:hypothetical protein
MRDGHWRGLTNDREGSQYRNFDAAFGPFLNIFVVKVYIKASNFLYLFFSRPGILKILETSGALIQFIGLGCGRLYVTLLSFLLHACAL